jgi:hypothetical protein
MIRAHTPPLILLDLAFSFDFLLHCLADPIARNT